MLSPLRTASTLWASTRFNYRPNCQWILNLHYYDSESREESMQPHVKSSSNPTEFKVTPSVGKIMPTILWDSQGILFIDDLNKGNAVNGDRYANLMLHLKDYVKMKKFTKLSCCFTTMHQCRSRTIKTCSCWLWLRRNWVLTYSAYSPDFTPTDYLLFPNLKKNSSCRESLCRETGRK